MILFDRLESKSVVKTAIITTMFRNFAFFAVKIIVNPEVTLPLINPANQINIISFASILI